MSPVPIHDGNGWVHCACGKTHWGLHGAAGLLVTSEVTSEVTSQVTSQVTGEVTSERRVLLQLRSPWTHNGGTWALPGGARDSHESPLTAAMREVTEETSLDPASVTVFDEVIDEHGPWSYTTVLAHAPEAADVEVTNDESDAMRWWPVDEVDTLPLHYGFAASWPTLRRRIEADTDAAEAGDPPSLT